MPCLPLTPGAQRGRSRDGCKKGGHRRLQVGSAWSGCHHQAVLMIVPLYQIDSRLSTAICGNFKLQQRNEPILSGDIEPKCWGI